MPRIKTNCMRLVATASGRKGYVFSYQRPVNRNDLKREGRSLHIGNGGKMIVLDGVGIKSLAKMLKACGELGRRVDRRRTRVMSTSRMVSSQPWG